MKTPSRILLFLATTALFASCTTSSTLTRGQATAQQGQRVADAGLKVLDQLAAVPADDLTQRTLALTLQFPDIEPTDLHQQVHQPNKQLLNTLSNIEIRQEAFNELKNAYDKYYELASTAFGESAKQSGSELVGSVSRLASQLGGKELPAAGVELAGALAELAAQTAQAKRVKACNKTMAVIAARFQRVWDNDSGKWMDQINATYRQHASVYTGLKADAFHPEQLVKLSGAPFEPKRSAWAYKIKAGNELTARARLIQSQLSAVSEAFGELAKLHKKLAEQKAEEADWKYTFERIGTIIDLIDKTRQEMASTK